jgi:hypothetical protein
MTIRLKKEPYNDKHGVRVVVRGRPAAKIEIRSVQQQH